MRKYTVQESNNIALGQSGFDVLAVSATDDDGAQVPHTGTWVAIKAVGGDITLGNLKVSRGDDIDAPVTFGATSKLEDGDIIYAPFNSIIVTTVPSGSALIAYRG